MLLRPVLWLMNKSRYTTKFTIILLVFMLPYCWLSLDKLATLNEERRVSLHEREGVVLLEQAIATHQAALLRAAVQVLARSGAEVKQLGATQLLEESQTHYAAALERLTSLRDAMGYAGIALPAAGPVISDTNPASPLDALYNDLNESGRLLRVAIDGFAARSQLSTDSDPAIAQPITRILGPLLDGQELVARAQGYNAYLTILGMLFATSKPAVHNLRESIQQLAQANAADHTAAGERLALSLEQLGTLYKKGVIDEFYESSSSQVGGPEHWRENFNAYQGIATEVQAQIAAALQQIDRTLALRVAEKQRALSLYAVLAAGLILVLLYLFAGFYLSVTRTLKVLRNGTQRLAAGDLREDLSSGARDELGELVGDFNRMQHRVRDLIGDVARLTGTTATQAGHLNAAAESSSRRADRQAGAMEAVTTAMGQLTTSVHEVSRSAQVSSDSARRAGSECQGGEQQMQQAVQGIGGLVEGMRASSTAIQAVEDESQKIAKVLDMIDAVAEQTNLLALNASIEAARAGEQGRGFAVVADEVRNLARRSKTLTQDIDVMVAHLKTQVDAAVATIAANESGVTQARQQIESTAQVFRQITRDVAEIARHATQIASATEQQVAAVADVELNAQVMRELGQTALAESHQAARLTQDMAQGTQALQRTLAAFHV